VRGERLREEDMGEGGVQERIRVNPQAAHTHTPAVNMQTSTDRHIHTYTCAHTHAYAWVNPFE